jgi:hypothetical protein
LGNAQIRIEYELNSHQNDVLPAAAQVDLKAKFAQLILSAQCLPFLRSLNDPSSLDAEDQALIREVKNLPEFDARLRYQGKSDGGSPNSAENVTKSLAQFRKFYGNSFKKFRPKLKDCSLSSRLPLVRCVCFPNRSKP